MSEPVMKPHFLLIAVVSLTTLAMELFFTKILSFVLWNHLVYLIISIALLGFGASSMFVMLARGRIEAFRDERFISANLMLLVLSVIGALAFIANTTYRFSPTHPLQSAQGLIATYFALTLPFFFAGNVIVWLFVSHPGDANVLYAWDLGGAALGCLLFPILMPWFGATGSVCVLLILLSGVALIISFRSSITAMRALGIGHAIFCIALAGAIPSIDRLLSFKPDVSKIAGYALNTRINTGVVHEYHKWDVITRLDILSSISPIEIGWMKVAPGTKLVDFDGDAGSVMARISPDFPTAADTKQFFDTDYRAAFFKSVANGNHLIVGLGGGPDLAQSLAMGASKITVVDINAAILDAMANRYRDYNGNILHRSNVSVFHSEGRNFLRSSREKFDLIRMTGVDTFTAHTAGAFVLAENYLYTVEAFRDYYHRLGDDGVLCLQRWFEPGRPRESLRLFAMILEALREEGIAHPEEHVIVLWRRTEEMQPPGTTFVSKRPYTPETIRALDAVLARVGAAEKAVPVYYPHAGPSKLMESVVFHAYANAFAGGTQRQFQDLYPNDISPPVDDKPFFFNYYKASNMLRDWKTTGPIHGYWAYFVFSVILVCASVAVSLFIWLPLFLFRREGLRTRGSGVLALYFSCLGIGFIAIEITAMQKFALLLGHPIYAIATVMGGMLVFAGAGSRISNHYVDRVIPALSVCTLMVAVFCLLLSSAMATYLIDGLLAAPLCLRIAATLLMLAPGSIPLGFFFPIGLRIAGMTEERFIPWAWGINSGFTVIGSVGTIAAAMRFGFSSVLMIAAGIYLTALLAIRRYQSRIAPAA